MKKIPRRTVPAKETIMGPYLSPLVKKKTSENYTKYILNL